MKINSKILRECFANSKMRIIFATAFEIKSRSFFTKSIGEVPEW